MVSFFEFPIFENSVFLRYIRVSRGVSEFKPCNRIWAWLDLERPVIPTHAADLHIPQQPTPSLKVDGASYVLVYYGLLWSILIYWSLSSFYCSTFWEWLSIHWLILHATTIQSLFPAFPFPISGSPAARLSPTSTSRGTAAVEISKLYRIIRGVQENGGGRKNSRGLYTHYKDSY